MGFLESLIVRLVVGLLGYLQAREDLKRRVLAEATVANDQRALVALRWLADAAARGTAPALRVREGGGQIELRPDPAGVVCPAEVCPLRDRGRP